MTCEFERPEEKTSDSDNDGRRNQLTMACDRGVAAKTTGETVIFDNKTKEMTELDTKQGETQFFFCFSSFQMSSRGGPLAWTTPPGPMTRGDLIDLATPEVCSSGACGPFPHYIPPS